MAHIIIADDDEVVTELVRDTFWEYGHVVGCVADGVDALQVLESKRPDLVILDCTMPTLSGLLTLQQIRASKQCYALPVLMLSGLRGRADVDRALRAGADGYIKKPFDPHHLVFRAEEIIGGKQKSWSRNSVACV